MADTGLTTITQAFEVVDAALYPLISDQYGDAAPVYGDPIDLVGVVSIKLGADILYKELVGDGSIIANFSRVRKLTADCEASVLNLNILKATLGGAVTQSGAAGARKSEWTLGGQYAAPSMKVEGRIKGVDEGLAGVILRLLRGRVSAFSMSGQAEDYGMGPTFTLACIKTHSTKSYGGISIVESDDQDVLDGETADDGNE